VFGDIGKIMKIAGRVKAKMPEMQQELENSEHTADAGGGAVTATVNGRMTLIDLKIDPRVLDDDAMDAEMLADLVKSAVTAAQQAAAEAVAKAMKELTGGMDIPGLSGIMGL